MILRNVFLIIVVSIVTAISGCKTTPVRMPDVNQITLNDFKRSIDPQFIQRCPELPIPPSSTDNTGDMLILYAKLAGLYNTCAIKDDCLISSITGNEIICVDSMPRKDNGDGSKK